MCKCMPTPPKINRLDKIHKINIKHWFSTKEWEREKIDWRAAQIFTHCSKRSKNKNDQKETVLAFKYMFCSWFLLLFGRWFVLCLRVYMCIFFLKLFCGFYFFSKIEFVCIVKQIGESHLAQHTHTRDSTLFESIYKTGGEWETSSTVNTVRVVIH